MIDTLDVKLLPRFDTVHPPELRRQNDLALGGDGGLHAGKIPSYLPQCQAHTQGTTTGLGDWKTTRIDGVVQVP